MNDNNSLTHTNEMKLQIPCGVCTEISKESILWRATSRDKKNINDTLCQWKEEIIEREV